MKKLRLNAWIGGTLLVLVLGAAAVGAVWQPYDPTLPDFMAPLQAPSSAHWPAPTTSGATCFRARWTGPRRA